MTEIASGEVTSEWEDQANVLLDVVGNAELLGEAISGDADAMSEAQAAIRAYTDELSISDERRRQLINTYGETAAQQQIDAENAALQKTAYDNLSGALGGMEGDYGAAAEGADKYATSSDKATTKADNLTASISALRFELDLLSGKAIDVEQAQIRVSEGIDRVSAALKESGGSLDINTEAGRASRESIVAQTEAIGGLVDGLVATGTSAEDAATMGETLRTQLITTMTQFGLTKGEAEAYLTTLGLTPETIETRADLASRQAEEDAARYQTDLDTIDATNPDSVVSVTDHGATTAIMNELHGIDGMNPKVNIEISTSGYALARQQLEFFAPVPGKGAKGTPMMGPAPGALAPMGLAASDPTATIYLRPRTLGATGLTKLPDKATAPPTVVESRIYVGNQQITDIVRQEARIIERDRSMAYIGGVPG